MQISYYYHNNIFAMLPKENTKLSRQELILMIENALNDIWQDESRSNHI